ncbi:MAG: hypothetical protein AAB338_01485 [Patescibacteria group bacterium]
MGKDSLVARFPIEKGPVIREIVKEFKHLFHHTRWEKDGNSMKLEGDICGPDSDDEGSRTRFLYDVEEMKIQMEEVGASVELRMTEFTR